MLNDGGDFYFVQSGVGIFVQSGEDVRALSADCGRNLNLYENFLYYTVGNEVRRMPKSGGKSEIIYKAGADIDQMYVAGGALKFLSGGTAFELSKDRKKLVKLSSLSDIKGLIPTSYGDIFLTGEMFDYTVWANDKKVLSDVTSCYTDSGYLAVLKQNCNYMAELKRLFSDFSEEKDLEKFNIHGTVSLMQLFGGDDENAISEYNDNNELQCDFKALLAEAGLASENVRLMEETNELPSATVPPPISEGQKNIVKRARQLTEIKWTPLEDIYQWGQTGVFKAETTYTGIPYGQPVNTNGYIGYGVSLEDFASAVLDNTSRLYTTYSTYNKIAPSLSTDCSGYVSYAWGIPSRKTTYSLVGVAEKVGDQSVYSLQVGDCLNKTSNHVVLVSGLTYDANGSIIGVEIMEQTPVITRVTRYGPGESKSLNSLQAYYFNNGYEIYRNPNRDSVYYTPSPVVPLDGETVASMKEPAPKSQTVSFIGGKTVTLTSDTEGASIYYTLDGSLPTRNSTLYTGAITFCSTAKLRAIAVSGNYSDSTILEYTVKVPQATAPSASVSSGLSSGNVVSSGSQIKLSSVSGATIYYTTDGTEPTSSSKVYNSPITITQDTTIKAMAEAKGMSRSQIAVFTYKVGSVFTVSASAGTGGSISPSGNTQVLSGGSVSFTISPSSGYAVSDVAVDGVSVGAVSSYTFSNLNANHTISASFRPTAQIPFTDTGSDAWYYNAVCFAYANGLFNGTSATTFSPDMTMTRGMFVTVLGRFAGVPDGLASGIGVVTGTGVNIRKGPSTETEVVGFVTSRYAAVQVLSRSGNWYQVKYGGVTGYIRNDLIKVYERNYTDLADGRYYSPYAEWAYLTGVANGTAGTLFEAESNITREHMCIMLYNYAQIYGKSLPQVSEKAVFSDDSAISAEAKEAVYALQQAGIINGMGNGVFSPKGTATRAQVAQIYMKFVSAVKQ
ncbi:MAG: SH3 domain-containing protein [Clostridiales bacterium]|nr:SH3 domain-containing protein [Clostridiales bacterium]